MIAVATARLFGTAHIALTAALPGAFGAAYAARRPRGEHRTQQSLTIGALSAVAVFLPRTSAKNVPQLNDDGVQGFLVNDWLAPTVTFVILGLYGAPRPAKDPRRFDQAGAAATVIALVVNVVTL